MERFWKYFFLLSWIFYLFVASLSVFLNGFLLNREVLVNRSSCKSLSSNPNKDFQYDIDEPQQICTEQKSKVVLMIIDALMYDFTLFNEDLGNDALPYQNKMPVFSELLKNKPSQSRLYKFIADPPTTTMQRLKGLTTGSLPTFIDAGSNFASYEIDEDNFLDQLLTQNKSIVFMGDDTWNSLYPERFLRYYPFPSFNVWDLDTVDEGVEKNIMPQMKKKDWDLLIAHFLGVDHCGHRYGPNHPEMTRKLNEMDFVVRRLVDSLDNDTMLIVIGDHGMTPTGNHGGDSIAEITAAMFIYSPHPLLVATIEDNRDSVNQVDLVPTLAAILGSPIPFSSLGSVIIEALPLSNWQNSYISIINNINQVHTYIETYSSNVNQFTEDSLASLGREYKNLQRLTQNIKTIDNFKSYLIDARNYLNNVKVMCEDIWVKFDLMYMCIGLLLMFMTITICLIVIQTIPAQKIFDILDSPKIFYVVSIIFIISTLCWFIVGIFLEISCILSLLVGITIIYNNLNDVKNGLRTQRKHNDRVNFIASILIIGNILGMFSNSYVVEESIVVSFWLVSLILAVLFSWTKDTTPIKVTKGNNPNRWAILNTERCSAIILAILFCICIRLFQNYWQCREEQEWCQNIPSISNQKSTSLFKEVTFLPLISIIIPIFIIIFWLKNCGNLVELSITITAIKIVPIIFTILTCVYWVLEALPVKVLSKMITWDIQLIPQIIYLLLVIILLCLVIQPLCVHVIPPRKKNFQIDGETNVVPHIFQHIKKALKEDKSKDKDNIPAVYGLPTVFSATFIVVGLLIIELLYLWQGSKFATALVIMFFSSFLLLGVLAVYRIHKAVLTPQLLYVPWYAVTAWGLLAVTSFYGTGHQATFPGIHWQAAFVGTSGEFSTQIIPGLMVTVSTFSAQVWLGLLLPLLLVCPFTLLTTCPKIWAKQDVRRGAVNGEVYLYENSTLAGHAAFVLCIKYIVFFALRTCASMLAALVLRRHLMVWKIFAPKLIFESAGMTVSMVAVLLGFSLLSFVSQRLEAFMMRLQDEHNS